MLVLVVTGIQNTAAISAVVVMQGLEPIYPNLTMTRMIIKRVKIKDRNRIMNL